MDEEMGPEIIWLPLEKERYMALSLHCKREMFAKNQRNESGNGTKPLPL
jgi:hypothetical protein